MLHITSFEGVVFSDALYQWQNPEYKAVEDSESLVVQFCLAEGSGTLTSQVQVAVKSTPISATGELLSYT